MLLPLSLFVFFLLLSILPSLSPTYDLFCPPCVPLLASLLSSAPLCPIVHLLSVPFLGQVSIPTLPATAALRIFSTSVPPSLFFFPSLFYSLFSFIVSALLPNLPSILLPSFPPLLLLPFSLWFLNFNHTFFLIKPLLPSVFCIHHNDHLRPRTQNIYILLLYQKAVGTWDFVNVRKCIKIILLLICIRWH